MARERDLCDVKIKITEYLPGTPSAEILAHVRQQKQLDNAGISGSSVPFQVQDPSVQEPLSAWCPPMSALAASVEQLAANVEQGSARLYTVQRVDGLTVNSQMGGNPGHKHTLDDSDQVKKNSVIRWMVKSGRGQGHCKVSLESIYLGGVILGAHSRGELLRVHA